MSTQVILLERIENLGNLGDVVSVKPGYARNYLLPQNKALRANKANLAYFEAQKKQFEADNEKRKKDAEKRAKKLHNVTVSLIRQASESGQLYGSVASRDIATILTETTKEAIGRSMVDLNQNIKTIGLFPINVILHPEVIVSVTVNVARTSEEAEIQEKTGKALISEDTVEIKAEEAPAPAVVAEDIFEDVPEDAVAETPEKSDSANDAEEAEAKDA